MDWKTWAPFQSKVSREICEHMTEKEKNASLARSGKYGVWCALTFAIPISVVAVHRKTVSVTIAVILLAIHIIGIPIWRKRQKAFLCSTQWAKSKEYNLQHLNR